MQFLQTPLPYLLAGISVGGQYALIAIGYTMVYGILRLINFAHGDVFMVAGMFMVFLSASLPLGLAIPLVLVITVLLGFLIERAAYKPLRDAPRMSVMIAAIGVSYLLQNCALYFTGGLAKVFPQIPWISDTVEVFGAVTKRVTLITPVLTVALVVALVLFIRHTKIGMAMRAVAKDFETSLSRSTRSFPPRSLSVRSWRRWAAFSILPTMPPSRRPRAACPGSNASSRLCSEG